FSNIHLQMTSVSIESHKRNSTYTTYGCGQISGSIDFRDLSCTVYASVATTYSSLIWFNGGGTSTGYGVMFNIGDDVGASIAMQLINSASLTNSPFYSLNDNGTATILNTIVAYGGGTVILD